MRLFSPRALAFALASLCFLSGAGQPKTTYEEEITVREKKDPSLTIPSPETAARELAEVPGGVSLVDPEDYKRGRASTLKDALDFTPGVFVQPRFGSEEARLSIRGSGLQRTFHGRGLKLLQDGVPLNLADGAFDFQAVEPRTAGSPCCTRAPGRADTPSPSASAIRGPGNGALQRPRRGKGPIPGSPSKTTRRRSPSPA